jgi:hypothetical protein
MLMKSVVFWVITQRRVVIVYRRFGTTYRSHIINFTRETSTKYKFRDDGPEAPKHVGIKQGCHLHRLTRTEIVFVPHVYKHTLKESKTFKYQAGTGGPVRGTNG